MLDPLKFIGPPGSAGLVLLGLCVAIFFARVWPRRRNVALGWLGVFGGGHAILAVPAVSVALARPLEHYQPVDRIPPVETAFVLGGDNSIGRIHEAKRLYDAQPRVSLIVLAEPWFVERLIETGIPQHRVRIVTEPATTREQLEWLRMHLQSQPSAHSAIIASRVHMARVAALAAAMDIEAVLLPAPLDDEPARAGVWRWVPSLSALRLSGEAIYERAALAYYEQRGWIQSTSR